MLITEIFNSKFDLLQFKRGQSDFVIEEEQKSPLEWTSQRFIDNFWWRKGIRNVTEESRHGCLDRDNLMLITEYMPRHAAHRRHVKQYE